jgi:hypothetical protein
MIKAMRCWTSRQTAKEFMIDEGTVTNWLKHLDSDDSSLFKEHPPVNKYPDFIQYATQQFKKLVPACGKKSIAEYFVRAGLNLCATTVGRYIKKPPIRPPDPEGPNKNEKKETLPTRKITSRYPNHTWMIDLTAASISGGFWSSIFPFSFPQKWPYCWWVAVIIDHFSRRVVGFAVSKSNPATEEVTDVIDKAIDRTYRDN